MIFRTSRDTRNAPIIEIRNDLLLFQILLPGYIVKISLLVHVILLLLLLFFETKFKSLIRG